MKCSITMAIAVILFTCTGVVHAQEAQENDRSFNVQNFRLAPGYGAFLTVEGANVMPDYLGFQVGGFLNYQYRPPSLVVQTCEREESEDCVWDDNALIEHHFSLELLAAFSIYNVFEVGLALPVVLYQNGETAADVEGLSANAGISDLRLHLKLDILQGLVHYTRKDLSLAFITVLSFPTGNAANPDAFMGDSGVTVEHKAAFGARFGRYRIGANLGYLWRETKEFYLKEIGPRLTYGVAVEVDLVKRWAVVAELFGQLGFTFDLASAPLEADFAARYDIGRHGLVATAGMGVGILAGVGTPVIRLFGGVMWTPQLNMDRDKDGIPDKDDGCPKDPEDKDNFEDADGCPDPDNDADGILDAEDGCPGEPEDMDDFEDVDGCPDPDNDGDGILDTDDVCPDEPEDMDDFEDVDGCPDPDNDGDSILDTDDVCPDEPEDMDDFEDVNGCPDPDNDGDGFPDQTDKCPNQAEVLNGFEDEDGCPDKGKQLVVVQEEKIRLLEKVRFATNSDRIIGKQSFDILISVAAVLKSRPAVKIRIEGHTDAVGSAQANRSLSERRADFVMNYLIKQGVEPDRLEAVGYGPDRPIAPNKTLAGRDTNRRVEFVITAQ